MKLEVKKLIKNYNSLRAVNNISFEAESGNIFGLIGPNGSGKTTTIRMIMNILIPDCGTILLNGNSISDKSKSNIGYLPEERGLYKNMRVNEILQYLSRLKGKSKTESQMNINYWLSFFKMNDCKNKKIRELSKGMSQKIQFIATIAHDPCLIFLDEPFSGLDPVSVDIMKEAILELVSKDKIILISTHNMEQAEKLCRSIFLINKGREVLSGNLNSIKSKYGNRNVIIEFEGNSKIIEESCLVSKINHYSRWIEAELNENVSADDLLQNIAGKISIRKFEVNTPSLHKIFIDNIKTI